MSADLAAFIDGLRLTRLARRIQQGKIAAQLGFGQSRLAQYENHRHEPDTETLIRWAAALGVELPDGLTGRIDPAAECGTVSGYTVHRRRGEDACGPCKRSRAAYMADYRQRGAS